MKTFLSLLTMVVIVIFNFYVMLKVLHYSDHYFGITGTFVSYPVTLAILGIIQYKVFKVVLNRIYR